MQSVSALSIINSVFDILKNIGPAELVVIITLIVGGLFGSKRVKELAEGMGESARELKKVKQELDEVKSDVIGGVKPDA